MKPNFKCPRCRKQVCVGKHLRAGYTCPNCKAEMLIREHERRQGHVDYKRNFMFQR